MKHVEDVTGTGEPFELQPFTGPLRELVEQCAHSVQRRQTLRCDLEQFRPLMRGIRAVGGKPISDKEVGNTLDALPSVSEFVGDGGNRGRHGVHGREDLPPGESLTTGSSETVTDGLDNGGQFADAVDDLGESLAGRPLRVDSMLSNSHILGHDNILS
ncbi:hypothetical protein AFA91_19695 [Mycolicibacterium goodii]|uniref:Uncharacterized protein n=1 Tax=Mycolicibacterium goodii TaxID=134601 RepID=A0A0K0X8P3_MYCGD|nr:hypothetical protein AFA91_19695 [Mycolicibacterium goodii]